MAGIDGNLYVDLGKLLNQGDSLRKILDATEQKDASGSGPLTDILSTPKDYIFYIDVPGLSKSDVKLELEGENVVVVTTNGKRKREDGEEEGWRYLKLERNRIPKQVRKFRLPQDADASSIMAKCENGVLSVTVAKAAPVKPKTVQVAVA